MARPDASGSAQAERRIATLFDFENIALGMEKSAKKIEIQPLFDRILEKGRIVVKRAYCDWSRYAAYKQSLHEAGFELIEIPRRRISGKNSADIRMVVDAMDLVIARLHVDTFALISGDSDFSPLVSKLREHDKYVIGLGLRDSSSSLLIDNCDEFIFYEDLVPTRRPRRAHEKEHEAGDGDGEPISPQKKAEAFFLVVDAVKAFHRDGYDSIWASMVKQTIKRKHPSFSETRHGFDTFSALIEEAGALDILKIKRDEKSGNYQIIGLGKHAPGRS